MPSCNGQGSVQDEPWFRIPACSSVFFALATLSLPSPDPSISSVHSMDFDDFPIFLVDSVADSSSESSPALVSESPLAAAESVMGIAEAESFASIGSFGTFGQRRGAVTFNSPFSIAESPTDEEYVMDSLCEYYMSTSLFPSPTDSNYGEARLVHQPTVSPGGPGSQGYGDVPEDIVATGTTNSSGGPDLSIHSTSIMPEDGGLVALSHPCQPVNVKPVKSDVPAPPREGRPTPPASEWGPSRAATPTPAIVSRPRRSAPHRTRKEKDSAVEFVWLHGISVDLLIDQESFRSATPSFKYSGVNRSKHDNATCTVTFRATSKQGYYFHYDPFDSSPILRRVTIHGEETKDYISKQAQLTLKANGIYSVHGAEVSSLSPLHSRIFNQLGHDLDKLDWEFEYLVQDRVDAHGRVMDGEKKFVPLTFTCSPWLLHPSQGKRVNLMHIFKKGVLNGKLTAEKAKVRPSPPPGQRHTDDAQDILVSTGDTRTPLKTQDHDAYARTHRRAKSHAVPRDEQHDNSDKAKVASSARARAGRIDSNIRQPIDASTQGIAKPETPRTLFRRSSAGDEGWLSMSF